MAKILTPSRSGAQSGVLFETGNGGPVFLLARTVEFATPIDAPKDFTSDRGDDYYHVEYRGVCRWSRVGQWLKTLAAAAEEADRSGQIMLAIELQQFLVEMDMAFETISRSDLAAAEVFVPIADRVKATFFALRKSFDEELKAFTQARRQAQVDYSAEDACVYDWNPLQSLEGVYVGWGIRFTKPKGNMWGDACESNCAYVIVHDEKEDRAEGWVIPSHWNFSEDKSWVVVVKPLHEFSFDPNRFLQELSSWMLARLVEAKQFTST